MNISHRNNFLAAIRRAENQRQITSKEADDAAELTKKLYGFFSELRMKEAAKEPIISLDELLYGEPTWQEVVNYWASESFPSEKYAIWAIQEHLLTDTQCKELARRNMTISDMLNGRVEGAENLAYKYEVYDDWNSKLGFNKFGS